LSELVDALKIDGGVDIKDDFTLDESEYPSNVTLDESGGNSTDSAQANITRRANCTQHEFENPEVEVRHFC